MLVEGRTVKSPGAGRGFLLSLDGITIYNLWKAVIANCENESYNRLKGPSIPAFTYRDGCLFDLSIPSKDDCSILTVRAGIRVINVCCTGDIFTHSH